MIQTLRQSPEITAESEHVDIREIDHIRLLFLNSAACFPFGERGGLGDCFDAIIRRAEFKLLYFVRNITEKHP
jgi:hypothetical protein